MALTSPWWNGFPNSKRESDSRTHTSKSSCQPEVSYKLFLLSLTYPPISFIVFCCACMKYFLHNTNEYLHFLTIFPLEFAYNVHRVFSHVYLHVLWKVYLQSTFLRWCVLCLWGWFVLVKYLNWVRLSVSLPAFMSWTVFVFWCKMM